MKTLWIALVLLIVVLTGSTVLFIYTAVLHNDLQTGLGRLQQQVERENWKRAAGEADQLKNLWRRADSFWAPIIDHRQVDRVDEALTRVFRLVDLEIRDSLLVEISVARRQLLRLKDSETPKLRNVF